MNALICQKLEKVTNMVEFNISQTFTRKQFGEMLLLFNEVLT